MKFYMTSCFADSWFAAATRGATAVTAAAGLGRRLIHCGAVLRLYDGQVRHRRPNAGDVRWTNERERHRQENQAHQQAEQDGPKDEREEGPQYLKRQQT